MAVYQKPRLMADPVARNRDWRSLSQLADFKVEAQAMLVRVFLPRADPVGLVTQHSSGFRIRLIWHAA
jgi:hypothetical protein